MTVYYLLSKLLTDVGLAEINAGHYSLQKIAKWTVKVIRPTDLENIHFESNDVIWCHVPCESLSDQLVSSSFQTQLKDVVSNGTNLLLTLTGCLIPYKLGIEAIKPQVIESGRWREEKGAYAYRGFMAYDEHPLFNQTNRFHTRLYTWTPQSGEPFWKTVYRDKPPDNVIARGVRILSATDDDCCCWEYDLNKGKILCIGAYLYFNARRNYKRHYSAAFLENCIDYLQGDSRQLERKFYWPEKITGIKEAKVESEITIPEIKVKFPPEKYFSRPGVPFLKANKGQNFFSCASRRMLLMGTEGKNIEEIWSYPVRIAKNLFWSIKPDGKGDIPQGGMECESEIYPDAVQQQYEYSAYGVREQIGTNIFKPAGYAQYEIVAERDFKFAISLRSDMAQMWPMPSGTTGLISYFYDKSSNTIKLKSQNRSAWCALSLSKQPESVRFKDLSSENNSEIEVEITFPLMKPGFHYLSFAIFGGPENVEVEKYDSKLHVNCALDIDRSGDHYRKLDNLMFHAITPDENINEGTRWAQLKIEAFRAVTPGLGRGLTAGLAFSGEDWLSARPGYGWYFGRDSLWSSLALLSVGHWNAVVDALKLLADRQSVDGKIFHELSLSNYAHYDSADANPLFLIVAERYLAWTGDDKTIRDLKPALKKALEFSFKADRDGDCLTENTGVGHGWIEGGKLFGAHVTFYLAGLWLKALTAAQTLFKNDPDKKFRERIELTALKVKEQLSSRFWDADNETYYYGILKDGSMMSADTIMPAAVILFGETSSEFDCKFLQRTSGPDIVSDWGARMISEMDERYSPSGYHIGSVWPLYTGWLGLAQYERCRDIQGYELLYGGISNYSDFSVGCFSEVVRGDFYKEIGVCPQQCWSAALMLWLVTKGMLGMEPESEGMLKLAPALPAHWNEAEFRNLRWVDGWIDLKYQRNASTITFTLLRMKQGQRITFMPRFYKGSVVEEVRINGELVQANVETVENNPSLILPLYGLSEHLEIQVELSKLLFPLPKLILPKKNRQSEGYRILEWNQGTDNLWIELMGRSATKDEIKILDPGEILSLKDIEAARDGEIVTVSFNFPDSKSKYSRTTLRYITHPNRER